MITAKTKDELKDAVLKREHILVTDKKLAKQLSLLICKKKYETNIEGLLIGKSNVVAATSLSLLTGLTVPVAITLIITVGAVTIVAILCNYRITRKRNGDIELEPV